MNNTKITKRVLAAVDRILLDGRSINAMMNGQIATEDGYAITDGFVSIHSPQSLTDQRCKAKTLDTGGVLRGQFLAAYASPDENVYRVVEPFELVKVASKLRGLCRQYQTTNRFKQSYITFTGENRNGERVRATFNARHIMNAFDCVGRKAVGTLRRNENLFNGALFLFVEDGSFLSDGISAIVLQSKASEDL